MLMGSEVKKMHVPEALEEIPRGLKASIATNKTASKTTTLAIIISKFLLRSLIPFC